jgi:hypothetical protein
MRELAFTNSKIGEIIHDLDTKGDQDFRLSIKKAIGTDQQPCNSNFFLVNAAPILFIQEIDEHKQER